MIPNLHEMISREAGETILKLALSFKAVALNGPRQSGKTTLLKRIFPGKKYVTLENLQERNFALSDPVQFLAQFPDGAILDEVQRAPELFSYLQQVLDEDSRKGLFILSGSNNFLLLESISQSLAGRVGYLDLLPFCLSEISRCPSPPQLINDVIFGGGYPAIAFEKITPQLWFPSYVRTYIERDVRQIKNISDLTLFQRLLYLCAGRVGQQINLSGLANDAGLDYKTVQSWLAIMQASYIVFQLPPYYKNFNKRVVKSSKLYFYDTGLACYLLGITDATQLQIHPSKGPLFENFVVSELLKNRNNAGTRNNLFYFRDSAGNEIDVLIDNGNSQIPIEVKAGETINQDFFKGLKYWSRLTGQSEGVLLYAGAKSGIKQSGYAIENWQNIGSL
jgi:predicted AAA+ superfamily ATPase